MNQNAPPKIAEWLLTKFFPDSGEATTAGDAAEVFQSYAARYGRRRAKMWYWGQVIAAAPLWAANGFYWRIVMFASYMKTALRNPRRQKGYAFINISGLAIGVAACLLILLYVRHETSYDRFHEKAEQIYRVASRRSVGHAVEGMAKAPFPAARALVDQELESLYQQEERLTRMVQAFTCLAILISCLLPPFSGLRRRARRRERLLYFNQIAVFSEIFMTKPI